MGGSGELWPLRIRTGNESPQKLKKKAPRTGPSKCTEVLCGRQSSGRGRQQLPVLRQNDRINGVNDAVHSYDVRLGDTGSIDPNVR
jgi:hypothetical protein